MLNSSGVELIKPGFFWKFCLFFFCQISAKKLRNMAKKWRNLTNQAIKLSIHDCISNPVFKSDHSRVNAQMAPHHSTLG